VEQTNRKQWRNQDESTPKSRVKVEPRLRKAKTQQ